MCLIHVLQVDAAVLAAAGSCPALEALSVAMCPGVDDACLTALAALSRPSNGSSSSSRSRGGGGVKELILDECSAVSDAGLLAIAGEGGGGSRQQERPGRLLRAETSQLSKTAPAAPLWQQWVVITTGADMAAAPPANDVPIKSPGKS